MRPTRIVTFRSAGGDGALLGINPLNVVAVRSYSEGVSEIEAVPRRTVEDRWLLVKGTVEDVIAALNRTLAASVTIVNDGERAISVSAGGDSDTREAPVLEPGSARSIQILGDLHVKIVAEDTA